jgi:hypothetical protein
MPSRLVSTTSTQLYYHHAYTSLHHQGINTTSLSARHYCHVIVIMPFSPRHYYHVITTTTSRHYHCHVIITTSFPPPRQDNFGLTSATGGSIYHSLRIRTPKEARDGLAGHERPATTNPPVEVVHGDFFYMLRAPALVTDRNVAQKSIAKILREGVATTINGLYEVGIRRVGDGDNSGAEATLEFEEHRRHCAVILALANNRGWSAVGFREIFEAYHQRACYIDI